MASRKHFEILKQGVEVWNQWRVEHADIQPNLSNVNLREANLRQAKFWDTDLSGANLINADLRDADLIRAKLSMADLSLTQLTCGRLGDANLRGANFHGSDLSGADIRGANLIEANLSEARLIKTNLMGADLTGADLSGADLSNANLRRTLLIATNLTGANLTRCSVYGASVWNVKLEGATQVGLVITPGGKPIITVDDLEVAQFIHLLLNHKKLRDVFNAVTERGVLLLGRFGDGGLEVLQAIATKLREENYLPIIFDFERPQDRNYTETVKTLAGLSRFIIADLSGPSVPQELYATVPHFKIPFVPIIEAGRKPFSMAVDLFEYPWVVRPPVTFATTEELLEQLPTKVIAPAEEKHQARQKMMDELFNKL
jgi:hypothetical protein